MVAPVRAARSAQSTIRWFGIALESIPWRSAATKRPPSSFTAPRLERSGEPASRVPPPPARRRRAPARCRRRRPRVLRLRPPGRLGRRAPEARGRRPGLPRRGPWGAGRVLPPLRGRLVVAARRPRDPGRIRRRAPGGDGLDAGQVHPGRGVDAARADRLAAPSRGRLGHVVRGQLDPARGRALRRRRHPRLHRRAWPPWTPWTRRSFRSSPSRPSPRSCSTRASSRRWRGSSSAASTRPCRRGSRTGSWSGCSATTRSRGSSAAPRST